MRVLYCILLMAFMFNNSYGSEELTNQETYNKLIKKSLARQSEISYGDVDGRLSEHALFIKESADYFLSNSDAKGYQEIGSSLSQLHQDLSAIEGENILSEVEKIKTS